MSDSESTEFFGEVFTVQQPSDYAVMEFSEIEEPGVTASVKESYAAIKRLVESCLLDEDLPRFRTTARKNRATTVQLMEVLKAGYASERPTELSSDSSDGQSDTEAKSEASSDVKVSDRLDGRPDLRQMIQQAKTA